jgi:hypothetical protein
MEVIGIERPERSYDAMILSLDYDEVQEIIKVFGNMSNRNWESFGGTIDKDHKTVMGRLFNLLLDAEME